VYFKIKRSTPLKKLMDAYGEKMGKKGLKFLFDGRRINPEMTADDLGLENEDVIEANLEQLGGFFS
jgi:small ubiquitin-related modifier